MPGRPGPDPMPGRSCGSLVIAAGFWDDQAMPDGQPADVTPGARLRPGGSGDPGSEPHGSRRFVTFLHGLGGSPLSWENQVAAMPAGFSARAPWLRGLRPGGTEPFSLPGAAADVLLHLQLEGVTAGALVGHSLGAMVALQIAVDAPGAVSRLVLVADQVRPPALVLRAQRLALSMIPARRFARSGISKDKMRAAMKAAGEYDAGGSLGSVSAPTLVVIGERDRANAPAARLLAEGIPQARLVTIAGAGHDVMSAAPGEFNALLWDFLAEDASGPGPAT